MVRVPERMIINFLRDLRFQKASRLLAQFEGLDSQQRLSLMLDRSPKRFIPFLLRYRYLALMVAVNLPGNIVIGGGGGIALTAGTEQTFLPIRIRPHSSDCDITGSPGVANVW